jgi:hypothetical protein
VLEDPINFQEAVLSLRVAVPWAAPQCELVVGLLAAILHWKAKPCGETRHKEVALEEIPKLLAVLASRAADASHSKALSHACEAPHTQLAVLEETPMLMVGLVADVR